MCGARWAHWNSCPITIANIMRTRMLCNPNVFTTHYSNQWKKTQKYIHIDTNTQEWIKISVHYIINTHTHFFQWLTFGSRHLYSLKNKYYACMCMCVCVCIQKLLFQALRFSLYHKLILCLCYIDIGFWYFSSIDLV